MIETRLKSSLVVVASVLLVAGVLLVLIVQNFLDRAFPSKLPFELPAGHTIVAQKDPVCVERGPLMSCELGEKQELIVEVSAAVSQEQAMRELAEVFSREGLEQRQSGADLVFSPANSRLSFGRISVLEMSSSRTRYQMTLSGRWIDE